MKILPEKFTKNNFQHEQIKRDGNIAIYKRHSIKHDANPHFEVVRVKSHNGYEIGGVTIPPSETYPSSVNWGVDGWTYNDETEAMDRFNSLLND